MTGTESANGVLLVDDNHEVREGLARVLRRSGFAVATAENGLEALEKLAESPSYRVVICDIMMPVMDGMHLYQQLEARHPQIAERVVFVSAWFDDPEVQAFLARTGRPVLAKPFEIPDLVRKVKEIAA
jgi:two-component system NtrC family sensor kinase